MNIRSTIDLSLTLVGVILVVVPVTLLTVTWTLPIVVLVGALMIASGSWRLGSRVLLPERRAYIGLRSEVDNFITMVRRLNALAEEGDTQSVEGLRVEMKESVDRMVSLAGLTGVSS